MILQAPVLLINGLGIQVYIQYPMMQPFAREQFAQARIFSLYFFPQFFFCLKINVRCVDLKNQTENQHFCPIKN